MEQQEIRTPEQLIADQAAWSFKREDNIRNALHDLREHPEKLLQRRAEFDLVIRRLNSLAALSGVKNPLPTLSELADMVQYPSLEEPPTIASLARERIFTIIRELIEQGEWGYVRELRYPEIITAALLIEGYGLMLEELLNIPNLGKTFVIAFEEILWTEFRGISVLLEDVITWMIEERKSFNPVIQRELEISYLIMSSNFLARYTGTQTMPDMHPGLVTIYSEIPEFDIVTEHCEGKFIYELSETGTRSLLIRLKSEIEESDINAITADIRQVINKYCIRFSAKVESHRYNRAVIFVDLCVPEENKKRFKNDLCGFEVNRGYVEESIYSRNQMDILELVWVSRQ